MQSIINPAINTAHPNKLMTKHIVSLSVKNKHRQGHTLTAFSNSSAEAPMTDGNGIPLSSTLPEVVVSPPPTAASLFCRLCIFRRILFWMRNGIRGVFSYESKLNTDAVSSSSPANMPTFLVATMEEELMFVESGFSTGTGVPSSSSCCCCWLSISTLPSGSTSISAEADAAAVGRGGSSAAAGVAVWAVLLAVVSAIVNCSSEDLVSRLQSSVS